MLDEDLKIWTQWDRMRKKGVGGYQRITPHWGAIFFLPSTWRCEGWGGGSSFTLWEATCFLACLPGLTQSLLPVLLSLCSAWPSTPASPSCLLVPSALVLVTDLLSVCLCGCVSDNHCWFCSGRNHQWQLFGLWGSTNIWAIAVYRQTHLCSSHFAYTNTFKDSDLGSLITYTHWQIRDSVDPLPGKGCVCPICPDWRLCTHMGTVNILLE